MSDTKNNSGDRNSGDWNSGDRNSGNWNSGDRNSGDWNSGYRNSGDWNSGDWNSGDRNSGAFNTTEPFVRMFNKDTTLYWKDITFPSYMYFNLTLWINKEDMSDQEKKDYPFWETVGGYLKTLDYKEAWKKAWDKASTQEKEMTKKLPNFDDSIFEEITGIKVDEESKPTEIIVNGVRYIKAE